MDYVFSDYENTLIDKGVSQKIITSYRINNKNIDYLICINASPYEINKYNERKKIVARNAKFFKSNVVYLNYFGCQDDLIFDGGTFIMNKKAEIIHQCEFFKESESIVNIERI